MATPGTGQRDSMQDMFATTDSRYAGYARQALGASWEQFPDGMQAILEDQRRREAEAARLRAMAAQHNIAIASTALPFSTGIARPPVAQDAGETFPNMGVPYKTATQNAQSSAPLPEMSRRIDTFGATPGPAKSGFKQVEVTQNGKMVGWQYEPVSGPSVTPPQGSGDRYKDVLAFRTDTDGAPPHGGMLDDHITYFDNMQRDYPESGLDPVTVKEAKQGIEKNARYVQRQAYGEPIDWTYANGDKQPLFAAKDGVYYYGLSEQQHNEGYLAFHPAERLPANATDAEKLAFIARTQNMYVAPRYKIGDSAQVLMHVNGKKGIIELQKKLNAAGFFKKTDQVVPGFVNQTLIEGLQAAMGQANIGGYDLDQTLAILTKHRNDLINKYGSGGSGGGSGPITHQVQIDYSKTSIAQGRSMLAQILGNAIGRSPTDQELSDYMDKLHAAEAKSPTKTVTNYVRSGSSQTSTSRTNPSNVDPEAMAREFAAELNGGGEMFDYKANSYFDNLMQMLMGAQNV